MADVMIPPWLQPQPIAQMYAQGMNTGVAAAAQQNEAARAAAALQQQAAIQASEMALRRDIAAQQAAQQGLSLQMDQQRNAALMALRERDMMNDFAWRSSRLQDYDQSLKLREQAMQNRMSPQSLVPFELKDGRLVYITGTGSVFDPNKPTQPAYGDRMDMQLALNVLSKVASDPLADPEQVAAARKDYENIKSQISGMPAQQPEPYVPQATRRLKVIGVR